MITSWNADMTKESNYITNVWYNLTEGAREKSTDLSNFGNEQRL